MKQITSLITHSFAFALNARHKAIMVSLILHLGIILLLFTSPMINNIPHSQIIFVALPNETGFSAASPAMSFQADKKSEKTTSLNHSPNIKKVIINDHDRSLVLEKNEPAMIAESVFSEDSSSLKEILQLSTETVAGTTGAVSPPSAYPLAGLPVGDGSDGEAMVRVTESRFGDRGAPAFVYQEIPMYPTLARRMGKEGRVILKLLIDTDGKLVEVEVVETAGYGFTEASIDAVKKSTYAPGYRGGVKVATWALLPVSFRLQ